MPFGKYKFVNWNIIANDNNLTQAIDSLFLGCCLNIGAQFDILRESYKGDKKKFVQDHQEIIDLSEDLIELVKPLILVQFFISSMALGGMGVQLTLSESIVKRIIALAFGCAMIIQLFSYCYGGQLIMDKSSSIADHFYELDKDFIIIIARGQNALTVKVGVYEANLPTFSVILNSAASFITLMKSFV